jgi:hypothetical protein
MPDDTRELAALLDAALEQLRRVDPDHPALRKLTTQFEAWRRRRGPADPTGETHIEIGSILSHRTKAGLVELTINREKVQFDLAKAREVAAMLSGAIEAAVSDQLLFAFLTTKVGLDADAAGRALLDFRELRQGSRGIVYPS